MQRLATLSFATMIIALSILTPGWALADSLDATMISTVDSMPPPVAEPTVVGHLLSWLAVLALGAVTMLMSLVGVLLSKKAKDSRIFGAINSLWVLAQTLVAHVERELRPKVAKALEDGKLTPEEADELKKQAIALFKEQAGAQLGELQKLLGLSESGLGTFISGLLEKAVSSFKTAPGSPTTVPAPKPPSVP